MHSNLIKVTENPHLRRDPENNAIIDVDNNAFELYQRQKAEKRASQGRITHLEERINMFESDIKDIKQLLQQLLER